VVVNPLGGARFQKGTLLPSRSQYNSPKTSRWSVSERLNQEIPGKRCSGRDKAPMGQVIGAMLTVVLWWFLLGVLFTGAGLLLRGALGLRSRTTPALFLSFWLGWGGALLFLQIYHCFWQVDLIALAVVGAAGILGLVLGRKELLEWPRSAEPGGRRARFVAAACWALGVLLLANHAIGPIRNYDTALYHLQIVRWQTFSPVVTGLGNLYGRLAFNNSSLLYMAMLESGPWHGRAQHLGNGLLLVVLGGQAAASLAQLCRFAQPPRAHDLFVAAVTPRLLQGAFTEVSGFSTDLPAFALGIVVVALLLRLCLDDPAVSGDVSGDAFAVCVLAAIGVTVKLSFVALGTTAFVAALWCGFGRGGAAGPAPRRLLIAAPVLALLAVIPWMIRNVILSGYILYPQTFGAAPVDWRVPKASADVMRNWICCWARKPWAHWTETREGWDWVLPWAWRVSASLWDVKLPLALLCFAAVLVLFSERRRRCAASGPGLPRPAWLLLIPGGASVACWFLTAPELRLGVLSIWCFTATALALSVCQLGRLAHAPRACSALVLAPAAAGVLLALATMPPLVTRPGADEGFYPVRTVPLAKFATQSGLIVLVPKDSSDPCGWDAPLPFTPHPHPRLAQRKPGDLSSGFRIEPFSEDVVAGIPP